jgi:hypothetical protein
MLLCPSVVYPAAFSPTSRLPSQKARDAVEQARKATLIAAFLAAATLGRGAPRQTPRSRCYIQVGECLPCRAD